MGGNLEIGLSRKTLLMSHAVCANPTSASRKGRRLLPSTVRRQSITRQRVPKLEPGIFFKPLHSKMLNSGSINDIRITIVCICFNLVLYAVTGAYLYISLLSSGGCFGAWIDHLDSFKNPNPRHSKVGFLKVVCYKHCKGIVKRLNMSLAA